MMANNDELFVPSYVKVVEQNKGNEERKKKIESRLKNVEAADGKTKKLGERRVSKNDEQQLMMLKSAPSKSSAASIESDCGKSNKRE